MIIETTQIKMTQKRIDSLYNSLPLGSEIVGIVDTDEDLKTGGSSRVKVKYNYKGELRSSVLAVRVAHHHRRKTKYNTLEGLKDN